MNCRSCSETLPGNARFCPHCGEPVAAAPAAPARAGEERRPVTVLFCDLVGSTALSGRLDPETLRSVVLRYFEAARTPIEAHGGTVEKFIGDAVMAVFGIPRLHEDDALRAAAAALGVLGAVERLNRELDASLGVRLAVRIGVSSGEAVVGTDADARQVLVSGEVPNVAARLEQNAAPGEILICPDTRLAVASAAVVDDAGPLELRGKTDAVHAFRLRALKGDDPDLLRRFDLPFVGRTAELDALDGALADVARKRTVRLLTLRAEAGLGKTRLLREWLERTPAGRARTGTGRCRPYGESGSLTALAEAVSALLDADDDVPGALAPATGAPATVTGPDAVATSPDLVDALALLRAGMLHDGTPDPSVEDTCAALAVVLRGLAAEQPLVLVLDDFHWSRPALRTCVERLSAITAGVPLLLICAGRPEPLEDPAGARADSAGSRLALPPLSEAECARLAAAHAERTPAGGVPGAGGPAVPARVLERAEGNPLLLEQLLVVAGGAGAEDLPPTVQALLGVRIDALGAAERAALSLAAVLGREFEADQVAGLAHSGPEGAPGGELWNATAAALRDLTRLSMVEEVRRRDRSPSRYRFASGLVQEVSYQRTAKRTRADRHERTADLLAASAAPDHEVGAHLEHAHQYRTELGMADDHTERLRVHAATYTAAAGALALARADLGWAEPLLRRAAALTRAHDTQRLYVLWQLAEVLVAAGELEEGRALLGEILTAPNSETTPSPAADATPEAASAPETPSRTGPDPGRASPALIRAHARLASAVYAGTDADPFHAARVADELMGGFVAAGDELGQARACLRMAQARQILGRHGEAERLLLRAADHALRAGAEPERAAVLGALGISLWGGPTPVPEAVERCRALLARHGVRRIVRVTLNGPLAVLLALDDRPEQATACLDAAEECARDCGYAETAVFLPFFRATVASLTGRPRTAYELLRQAGRAASRLGAAGTTDQFARAEARALLDAGRTAAARELLPQDRPGPLPLEDAVDLHGLLARALVGTDPTRALTLAHQAVAEAEAADSPVLRATAALDLACCAAQAGLRAEALGAAGAAHALFTAKGHRPGVRRAEELLGATYPSDPAVPPDPTGPSGASGPSGPSVRRHDVPVPQEG
ncbi:adenylate/guanylate cyclase domain-containing protein [Streptomyces montanisoli]|uniref:AAA family ATPase n=1 Tax=Streptomyces montanisoli TaxID=2798581 RepID=A0A940RV72_9ACTN|nr:adenylate/guanylate cyclase domain-containing protein [Streptomyces montanisoli]MBP0458737.1 AAA family ATPase [Streptomyces montanisoli]